MKIEKVASILMLVSLLTIGLNVFTVEAPNGPKTPNLLIHIYTSPGAEFAALAAGTIDITDWPFDSAWIATFSMPGSGVELRSYGEIGHVEFDINNQRWPTGVATPRTYDPETGTYKHYYDDGGTPGVIDTPDERATEFRKAIAHLTDKDDYITTILGGYAYRQDTNVPYPACAAWVPSDLEARGLIYDYDPSEAAARFDAGGFTQGTTPNPFYDPLTPGSAMYMRIDPLTGSDLAPLDFLERGIDHLDWGAAAVDLENQLKKAGISVTRWRMGRALCYNRVMVAYNFHLYTGYWYMTPDAPDDLHFLFHSSQYWGGTLTSPLNGISESANYGGFCDHNYDYRAEGGKYGSQFLDVRDAGYEAQYRMAELSGDIPLWTHAGVKGFGTGWTGVINMEGYGPDNWWSFLNMGHPTDNTIDWGLSTNIEGLNVVTAGTGPYAVPQSDLRGNDWKALALVYDNLLALNPYTLAEETGILAEDWTPLTIMSSGPNAGLAYIDFTLRSGATFHGDMDGIPGRDPVRPRDVKFSLEFMKASGPAVAWNYDDLKNIDHVETQAENASLGALDVRVFFVSGVQSYWALHWAGFVPILSEALWMQANANYGWGYVYGETDFNNFPNREMIRNYQPSLSDQDSDGNVDVKEDGCGPWIFESMNGATPPVSTAFAFTADTAASYFLSRTYVSDYLEWAFWAAGDTTRNNVIDIVDASKIANAMVGIYDPEANIAPDPWWDEVSGTGHGATVPLISAEDLGKWGRATKFVFPRPA